MSQKPPESGLDAAITLFLIARKAIKEHTWNQYKRILNLYRQEHPEWPPTPEGIVTFIKGYQESYEDTTTYTYYSILRNFIRFAYRKRLITDDPLDEISPPRRPGNLPRAPMSENLRKLTSYFEKEVERVISAKKKPYNHWGWHKIRNLALYSAMLDSGLRVSEAVNVRLEDIDLEDLIIFVRLGKGTKQREVPMGITSRGDLKFWLNYRILIPTTPNDPGFNHLFISHRRGWQPMNIANVEKMLIRACDKAGIPKITPHQLRHAFASLSHANGAPIGRIQEWLGHSDPGTTSRYLMTREGLRDHLKSSPRDHQ